MLAIPIILFTTLTAITAAETWRRRHVAHLAGLPLEYSEFAKKADHAQRTANAITFFAMAGCGLSVSFLAAGLLATSLMVIASAVTLLVSGLIAPEDP